MTLGEAGEIFAYWERDPPAHLVLQAIARMLGWAPPAGRASGAGIDELAASPPPGLAIARDGASGMPPAALDPEGLRVRNRARAAEQASFYPDRA